jgi:hypothetical protein
MNLFGFGKAAPVTLVRAWCSPFGTEELAGEYLAFVDALLALIPAASFEGAVNEGDMLPLSSLRRTLGKLAACNAGSLLVHDEAGEPVLAVLQDAASARSGVPVYEVAAVLPPGLPGEVDRALALLAARELHYAYARPLASGVDPMSESRTRRALFPGAPVREEGGREGWLVPLDDVRAGAVRGLYPANVLSAVALARLSGVGLQLPRSVPDRGGVLWRLDAQERSDLLRQSPAFRDWLHFGAED